MSLVTPDTYLKISKNNRFYNLPNNLGIDAVLEKEKKFSLSLETSICAYEVSDKWHLLPLHQNLQFPLKKPILRDVQSLFLCMSRGFFSLANLTTTTIGRWFKSQINIVKRKHQWLSSSRKIFRLIYELIFDWREREKSKLLPTQAGI